MWILELKKSEILFSYIYFYSVIKIILNIVLNHVAVVAVAVMLVLVVRGGVGVPARLYFTCYAY